MGANDRINIGVIGCGGRGSGVARDMAIAGETENARIAMACDVYQKRVNKVAAQHKVKGTLDYREVLDNPEIDAVYIATPDHLQELQMNTLKKAVLTLSAAAATLCAQGLEKNLAFQFVTAGDAQPAMMSLRVDSFGGKPVTGKPFSATEVRRTRQTLGDGTHIDKAEKDKYFRDFDGRTRIEREDGGTVIITDPATGSTSESSNGKSKVMTMRSTGFATTSSAGGDKAITINHVGPELSGPMLDKVRAEATATAVGGYRVVTDDVSRVVTTGIRAEKVAAEKAATDDLGDQIINGVMAHGTRSTITIPVNQIGNDREIKVISERWFSSDLGVLIKSTNNDPRFGETTYELTDILQGAQDPTLFQSPKHE